jgi:hypothetical protein
LPFFLLVALFTSVCSVVSAETPIEPEAIISEYVAASSAQQNRLQGASMEVEINAEVPKLHESARMVALRRISKIGRITYEALRFEGDRRIKNDVIARYLTAEAEAQKSEPDTLAVTPANYKFKYKGLIERDGRKVYAFRVSPRKKRVGLYEGDLWLDPETHLPVRESGRLVKNPSIFISRIEFVRDYQTVDGVVIPRRTETSVNTRLVGKAKLSIAFTSVSLAESQIARSGGSQ